VATVFDPNSVPREGNAVMSANEKRQRDFIRLILFQVGSGRT
jgi:hypothetical protein